MKKKIIGILVMTLLITTAFSVNGCVELNDINSNISIDKCIASSSTTADYKSFFNRHKEGESNILNKNGNWQWAKGAGGTDYDLGVATTTLSDDSTIVIGSFSGSATFGKGESAETVLVSDGSDDIFVAHYNTDGTIMWAKRAGGTSKDVGQGIVTLSDDSTVVTGSFEGIADFGPYNLTSQGDSDIFVAKLSNDGENLPPNTPDIDGPLSGNPGTSYDYIFNSEDPDGDNVTYFIDWGDGYSDETDSNPSGTDVTVPHTWAVSGKYTITAFAKDELGNNGPSSTYQVTMPRDKVMQNSQLLKYLENHPKVFPMIRRIVGLLN